MVESFGVETADQHLAAWRDLVDRAIEPNVFMDPDFAAPAAMHLPPAQRPEFIAVWEGAGFDSRARLIALAAVETRRSFLAGKLALGWLHAHSALGAPLVDRMAAPRAIAALFDWIARERPAWVGLALPRLVQSGPLFASLIEHAAGSDRAWSVAGMFERAILRRGRSAEEILQVVHSRKHRKDFKRKGSRLAELGAIEVTSCATPADMRAATEMFLAMEQKSWKGGRGTALLSRIGDATFARAMTRLMSRRGQCRIDALTLNGVPIAMAIILTSGGRSYFWKTAFDERYAVHSPGALLARALVNRQLATPGVDITDSCAIAGHPMIERIWPDRQTVADLEICCDPRNAAAFQTAVRRRAVWRDLRSRAKMAVTAALRRKVS